MWGEAIFAAMKKLLFLGVCLVALASQPALAQTGEPPVIVVQLYYTGLFTAHITITRGDNKTEDIEFKETSTRDYTTAQAYQRVLVRLYQEGYALKSTFKSGENQPVTLIFDKRP
jgi:hypothetical protein